MALKVLIADDERLFRQSLKKLLESEKDIKVIAEAADGQEAVLQAQDLSQLIRFSKQCLMVHHHRDKLRF